MNSSIREVDPNDLRLPPSRASGVDPWKLHQQIRQFGSRRDEMPPILVYEDPDGVLEISDGVTRATRIAKLAPGEPVRLPTSEGSIVIGNEMRAELFAEIRSMAEIVPEMRAGQLMAALGELCVDLHGRGLWDASDAELLEVVWQFRRNLEASITSSGREA